MLSTKTFLFDKSFPLLVSYIYFYNWKMKKKRKLLTLKIQLFILFKEQLCWLFRSCEWHVKKWWKRHKTQKLFKIFTFQTEKKKSLFFSIDNSLKCNIQNLLKNAKVDTPSFNIFTYLLFWDILQNRPVSCAVKPYMRMCATSKHVTHSRVHTHSHTLV